MTPLSDPDPLDPAPHVHDHVYLGASHDENARRTLWVVWLTAAMMVAEIVAGQVTGSMALLADGFHMGTHVVALGVAALAYRYARTHAGDPRYSFGTGKVGDLAGFASALVLGIVAIGIVWESVARLLHPATVAFGEATLVAVIGLAVNIASAALLSGGHHHDHHDHDHDHGGHDNNFRSAYVHVIADALTSVLAIVALLAGRYLGWVWLDPAVGILGAIVITRWAWSLLRDTAAILLDTTDPHIARDVRTRVEAPGDARITDLHVWRVGPDAHAAIVCVLTTPGIDADAIRHRLRPVHAVRHLTVECR